MKCHAVHKHKCPTHTTSTMLPVGNGPSFGPIPPLSFPKPINKSIANVSYTTRYTGSNLTQSQSVATNVFITISEPTDDSNVSLSQPLNLSYFPPNQEQFLNMQRPSMAPAPQHANTQPSRTTSASEDEEESTCMAQDIPW